MMEELALDYFRGLNRVEKKSLIKKILASLSEEEKLDLAKMLIKK